MISIQYFLLGVLTFILFDGTVQDHKTRLVDRITTLRFNIVAMPLIFYNIGGISLFAVTTAITVIIIHYIQPENFGLADVKFIVPILFIFPEIYLFGGALILCIILSRRYYKTPKIPMIPSIFMAFCLSVLYYLA